MLILVDWGLTMLPTVAIPNECSFIESSETL